MKNNFGKAALGLFVMSVANISLASFGPAPAAGTIVKPNPCDSLMQDCATAGYSSTYAPGSGNLLTDCIALLTKTPPQLPSRLSSINAEHLKQCKAASSGATASPAPTPTAAPTTAPTEAPVKYADPGG